MVKPSPSVLTVNLLKPLSWTPVQPGEETVAVQIWICLNLFSSSSTQSVLESSPLREYVRPLDRASQFSQIWLYASVFLFSFFLFFLSKLVYWWWRRRTLQWRRRRKQQRRSQWRRCCCRELLFYLLLWENHSLPFNVLTSFFSQYALSLVRPPPPLPDPEKPPLLNQAKTPKLQPPLPELQLQEPASPLSLLLLLPDPALQLHPSSQSLQPLTTQSPRLPPDLLPQLLLQDPL